MAELWTRISSLTYANRVKWDIELSWILATKMFSGVRVNIGLAGNDSDDIVFDPGAPNYLMVDYVAHRLASNGLRIQLGIGGDGPPKDGDWVNYNSSVTWNSVKRPPLGPADALVIAVTDIKSEVIRRVVEIFQSYGLDPYHYVIIEFGNELAIGGAGAPESGSSFYTNFGLSFTTHKGLWDAPADIGSPPAVTNGATALQYLTKEAGYVVFPVRLQCIAPIFAANRLVPQSGSVSETTSYWRSVSGENWIDLLRAKCDLIWGLNCYYDTFDQNTGGVHPQLYVWPTLGPMEYADIALNGFDGEGARGDDGLCIKKKIANLRAPVEVSTGVFKDFIGGSPIVLTEAGVHYRYMGMTDDQTNESVGDRDAAYFVNYQVVGQATLAYLDALRELDVPWVTHYTVADPISSYAGSTAWRERFGIMQGNISDASKPALQSDAVYSGAIPWAHRSGLGTTDRTVSLSDQGTYWNKEFVTGVDENVPL
ncbi:MAG TPA: hypothetical protein PKA27_14395 [Fimbriimonadaceae bacterium]|nr:hypothetical protein [Fimbriimonadaceae bacterium]